MKTYNDLYKDFTEFVKQPISDDEYAEIMNTNVLISDIVNEIIKYGRFAKFSKDWLEKNKEEILNTEE